MRLVMDVFRIDALMSDSRWDMLLPERIRPHYAALGLLEYENEPAAPELGPEELLV